MKFLFVIGALTRGGAERVISNLANHFVEIGDDVTIITLSKKDISYEIDSSVDIINGINGNGQLMTILKLRKIIKNTKPDIALSFLTHINIATIIATIGLNIPVVVSERNDPKKMPPEISRKILRRLIYPVADGFVFQTKKSQEYFSKGIQRKSTIIPNPIFLNSRSNDLKNKNKEIVTVGRLVPHKNQQMIIRSFARIEKDFSDYTLHIYGDGDQREELNKLINKLNLKKKIFLHGETSLVHNKIRDSEIFILASDFEGMPNALMEAMALGLACISTDSPSGGPEFLIDNNKNGILIPVRDEDKLTEALHLLLHDKILREKISENAKEIYHSINPEEIYTEWRNYLTKISNSQSV